MSGAAQQNCARAERCGMLGLRVVATDAATEDELLQDAAMLLANGISCLESWCEVEGAEMPRLYWPAIQMLRQAVIALEVAACKRVHLERAVLQGGAS